LYHSAQRWPDSERDYAGQWHLKSSNPEWVGSIPNKPFVKFKFNFVTPLIICSDSRETQESRLPAGSFLQPLTAGHYLLKDHATIAGKEDKNKKAKSKPNEPSTAEPPS
jgi:hypothetical protein